MRESVIVWVKQELLTVCDFGIMRVHGWLESRIGDLVETVGGWFISLFSSVFGVGEFPLKGHSFSDRNSKTHLH
jgi:hypothetical protein